MSYDAIMFIVKRSALQRTKIESKLMEIEEKILNELEAEEIIELTELVEEEPVVIELTEKDEVKPLMARRWGEVCAPKPPHKPMAKRRWGMARVASPSSSNKAMAEA